MLLPRAANGIVSDPAKVLRECYPARTRLFDALDEVMSAPSESATPSSSPQWRAQVAYNKITAAMAEGFKKALTAAKAGQQLTAMNAHAARHYRTELSRTVLCV